MGFVKEKELEKRLKKNREKIKSFFKIGCGNIPREWKGDFFDTKVKLFTEIDKFHFLKHRGGLDNFTLLSIILKKLNKNLSKVDLFEAGAYSKVKSAHPCYAPDIPYFMASGQVNYNYFGFEPNHNWNESDLETIFSEESSYEITEKIKKEDFRKNLEKNLTSDYKLFEKKIFDSKAPVVFSNLVLGCPNMNWSYDFWNLPALHMHKFLPKDLIKKNIEECSTNNQLKRILKEDYKIKEDINLMKFNREIVAWYKVK
jgi:hypothetical protein